MASEKPTLQWTYGYRSLSYALPYGDERGRVVPSHNFDGTERLVIAHVWGPDAGSEATESLTLEPEGVSPHGTLVEKARLWVEGRVKALDEAAVRP